MIIDGEENMVGDEADFWVMYKAQRARKCVNVYFKGQLIWVGGSRPPPCSCPPGATSSAFRRYGPKHEPQEVPHD